MKTAELLSTTVGLLMGYREGGARQPYKPGSVVEKVIDEVVEHLKDWPYPEPSPTPQADSAHDEPLQAFDSPRAKALMRAWEEGWAACRDAEYVGEEAQNDAFNSSHTLTLCIAEDQQLPAPQADSHPAPANTRQIAECYGDCPTDPKTCANPCNFVGRAARAPADSQPAPVVDRDRIREIFMAHGFTVKEGQSDLKQYVYDAADALLRAARAPADSVTAPAYSLDADPQGIRARVAEAITGAMAFGVQGANPPPPGHWLAPFWESARWESIRAKPAHPSADTLYLLRRLLSNQHTLTGSEFRAELGKIVEDAHAITPPAQAADSVLEDAADPLQGAANRLVKAHSGLATSTLAGKLSIGYNRAKRLHDAARKQGANHD